MSVKIDSLCVIGLGLIGGSLAAALRGANPSLKLIAIDHDADTLQSAKSSGLIDEGYRSVDELSDIPQVAVVAVPVAAMCSVFAEIKPWFQRCLAITDVGSAKQSVLDDLATVLSPEQSGCFVPGHPIAGREQSGLTAALSVSTPVAGALRPPPGISASGRTFHLTSRFHQGDWTEDRTRSISSSVSFPSCPQPTATL